MIQQLEAQVVELSQELTSVRNSDKKKLTEISMNKTVANLQLDLKHIRTEMTSLTLE